jgi:large subunit ribosomal protein L6
MARVLNQLEIPAGVTLTVDGQALTVKGAKGSLVHKVHPSVEIVQEAGAMRFAPRNGDMDYLALVGTTRALANSMIKGVTGGFEKKLELVGVGYRAQAQGKVLNLSLGFSHPIAYSAPEGITIETPSQTEILVKGIDKQMVGQVAADIRGYRPPEPYKGKGVRYAGEHIVRKEAKKK